ncbi:MAG TPA: hypothetical protein VNO79_02255 [Actinomycetota bacterium]|nr:hypothetical protein [Actinomycetota bacterium]
MAPAPPGSRPLAGLLVLKVWFEPDHSTPLRARIVGSVDPSTGGPELVPAGGPATLTATAASVDEVVRIVRRWLEGFGPPEGGPPGAGRR